MKPTIPFLLLCLSALADNRGNGSIPVHGCYCEEGGLFRSGPLMQVGERYTLTNREGSFIAVTVMPGSVDFFVLAPGETHGFTSRGTALLVNARKPGERVKIELRHIK